MEEKIKRRLTPFVVEGRIAWPAIQPVGSALRIEITARQSGWGREVLERDLNAALADIGHPVEVEVRAPGA
jgi:hypothetical protein